MNGFRTGTIHLLKVIGSRANAARLGQHKPTATEIVRYLAERGGSVRISQIKLAEALGVGLETIRRNLNWLEAGGALAVRRGSVNGLRMTSTLVLNVDEAIALFCGVLGGLVELGADDDDDDDDDDDPQVSE
jgi:DNA-binding transcriptional ArsR family regulator